VILIDALISTGVAFALSGGFTRRPVMQALALFRFPAFPPAIHTADLRLENGGE
jgi:hypothetical protein